VIREVVKRSPFPLEQFEDVIVGCGNQADVRDVGSMQTKRAEACRPQKYSRGLIAPLLLWMSASGHKRTFCDAEAMSALPPTAEGVLSVPNRLPLIGFHWAQDPFKASDTLRSKIARSISGKILDQSK
jgi:hypothetical protein